MKTDDRSVEDDLTGIANDLKPEVDRAVAELGREQVLRNIDNALERLAAMRVKRIVDRLDMRHKSPDEARNAIRYVVEYYPDETRFIYTALANKVWLLLRAEYTGEVRDWHVLIRNTQAALETTDPLTVERLNVLADLLRASITDAEIGRTHAASEDGPPSYPNDGE